MERKNYDIFIDAINEVFFGCDFKYQDKYRRLNPTILSTNDILKKNPEPITLFDMYLESLPDSFKETARSEMYRKDTGWIPRGLNEQRIRFYSIEDRTYLVPLLSTPTVGIDSSGLTDSRTIVICFFDNYNAAIEYFCNHLKIPKSSSQIEYKWNKLNQYNRSIVLENFIHIISMSCRGILAIHTNFIEKMRMMNTNIFTNMIDGCFTGYRNDPRQNLSFRNNLRSEFFSLCNNIPIHCDPDFLPLKSGRVVRLLVRVLSRINNRPQPCTPLHAEVTSEESNPIQVADLIAGVVSQKILQGEDPPNLFHRLFFDARKLHRKYSSKGVFVKSYYWTRKLYGG
jgi:hypothetical protein